MNVGEAVALAPRLRKRGFLIQDLLSVALGLRPMCRSGVPASDPEAERLLESFCLLAGLSVSRTRAPEGDVASVGRRAKDLREFERVSAGSSRLSDRHERLGALLGYPPCCRRAFTEGAARCLPLRVLLNSGKGPFPWTMNTLYSFHSRPLTPELQLKSLLNRGYKEMDLFLLPWIPCSFRCEQSLLFARRLFRIISAVEPAFAETLRRRLRVLILFRDDLRFVVLDGARSNGRGWTFSGEMGVKTLAPPSLVGSLAHGGELAADEKGRTLVTGSGTRRLGEDWSLFDFNADDLSGAGG